MMFVSAATVHNPMTLQQKYDFMTRHGPLIFNLGKDPFVFQPTKTEASLGTLFENSRQHHAFQVRDNRLRVEIHRPYYSLLPVIERILEQNGVYNAMIFASAYNGSIGSFRKKDGDDALMTRIVDFL